MFAETEILPDDCLPHESNGTLSGPQSGGTMRHKIDVLFDMQRRKVATTFDARSEETWIEDTPRRRQVRAENARRVAEENEKIQRRFQEESSHVEDFFKLVMLLYSSRNVDLFEMSHVLHH